MMDVTQATCEIFTLTLLSLQFEVLGMVISLDAMVLRLNGEATGSFVGKWACALAEASWLDGFATQARHMLGLFG